MRARGRCWPGPSQGHPAHRDTEGGGSCQGEQEAAGLGDSSAPEPNCLLFPPKKLIMEKLMEDDAFRKELAQSTAMRCQRKQPLGSRREPEPLPNGVPEQREEEGGLSWDEGLPLGQAPFEEAEELEDESEELEEPVAGPEAAVPKFEGKRSICVVPRVQRGNCAGGGRICWGPLGTCRVAGAILVVLGHPGSPVASFPGLAPSVPAPGADAAGAQDGSAAFQALAGVVRPTDGPRSVSVSRICGSASPSLCGRLGVPWPPRLALTGAPCASPVVPSPDFSFHADEHLEVYVSAAENPNHFWIQIIGHRSLQLDKLTTEMRQYYQSSGRTVRPPGCRLPVPQLPLPILGTSLALSPPRQSSRPSTQGTSWPLPTWTAATGTEPVSLAPWRMATLTFTTWILGTTGRPPTRRCEPCGEHGVSPGGGTAGLRFNVPGGAGSVACGGAHGCRAGGISPGNSVFREELWKSLGRRGHAVLAGRAGGAASWRLSLPARSDFLSLPFQALECSLAGIAPAGEGAGFARVPAPQMTPGVACS